MGFIKSIFLGLLAIGFAVGFILFLDEKGGLLMIVCGVGLYGLIKADD